MRSLSIIVILFVAVLANGQTFSRRLSFGTNTPEEGFSCYEIGDRYVFVGGYNDPDVYSRGGMFALDHFGEILNSNIFFQDSTTYFISGSSGGDIADSIMVAGGIIARSPDYLNIGVVVSFNQYGDTLFTHDYTDENLGDVYFYKGLIVQDGYLGCGVYVGIDDELASGILVKFDLDGNFLWRKDYPPQNNLSVFLHSAVQTPDGGYLLGGSRIAAFDNDHLVIKTDSLGDEEWRKIEGNENVDGIAKVEVTADGKYIFCGYHSPTVSNSGYPQVTKLDIDGDVIWTEYYGNLPWFSSAANSIKLLSDGSYILCGIGGSSLGINGFIRRIDDAGNEIWARLYQQTPGVDAWFNDVTPTSDGGFILTGLLGSDNDLGLEQDMWAMKVDSFGCLVPGCQLVNVDEQHPVHLSVYPNPADDFINVFVESLHFENAELILFDAQGRQVRTMSVRNSAATHMIESTTLPEGIYILHLQVNDNAVVTEKVIVAH